MYTAQSSSRAGVGAVLLIENEEMIRDMAKDMVSRLGYTVLAAKDGVEAIEMFVQHQDEICCVVSDETMPRITLNGPTRERCAVEEHPCKRWEMTKTSGRLKI